MKREIKFRGKRKLNGDWVYGSLFRSTDEDCDSIIELNETLEGADSFRVITNTIGQYTGLKDKNGNEIYEGDIVKVYNAEHTGLDDEFGDLMLDIVGKVTFEMGAFVHDGHSCGVIPVDYLIEDTEVIGNIYQNPELLKS